MTYRSVSDYFEQNAVFKKILFQLKQLEEWNKILEACLAKEPSLKKQYQITQYSNGVLVILAENAQEITRLRFYSQELLKQLASYPLFKEIRQIQFKIRPGCFL